MMPALMPESVADTMTILRASGSLKMTKTWLADGTISAYDEAKNFRIKEVSLGDIHDLHRLLVGLAAEPQSCAIRGQFIGAAAAQAVAPPEMADHYRRLGTLFTEIAHHWMLTDVDGFRPDEIDPNTDPVAAIDQYIGRCLPECFQGRTYVWQLSASAGAPGKEGVLKAHLWFWSEVAYTGPQITAWARATGAELDISVLRKVQPNFTAAPVFDTGVVDPITVRMGFEKGWAGDEVPLVIDAGLIEKAGTFDAGGGTDGGGSEGVELVDPKTKPGLIGLFCRNYAMEDVIERWLPQVFEFQDGSDRRLNYLHGGGSPGGAFVSDCREYIVNMHNTDPLQGRATNKWDLVRHYVHGDKDEGADPLALAVISTRPSHTAMAGMVAALPEVKAELRAAKAEAAGTWVDRVAAAADQYHLREVAAEIRGESGLDSVALEQLAGLIQARFKTLEIKVPLNVARTLIGIAAKGKRLPGPVGATPVWAKTWCFVTDNDCFFDLATKEKVTERGFNAMHMRNMKPFADVFGVVPLASHYALNEWRLPCVAHMIYMPTAGAAFEMLGSTWANTYRPASVPEAADYAEELSGGWLAVETVKAHLRKFFPDVRERYIFTSWLAHNVQRPGVKIRWAPYLHGYEGDGKSFFVELLAAVMGARQVRTVSGSTLQSNFTDWAMGYAAIGIEEMKQHGHDRHDVMNRIKPFITNSTVEIHPKGKASYVAPNTANYLILSNFLDGAPIDENSRRYMFVSSGIRQEELLQMNESGYFVDLFATLSEHPGALRSWLLDFKVAAEFDANGRAPETDIRRTVVELSRTETESVARDAIRCGIEGVCKTVISSAHLTSFLITKLGDEADIKTTRTNSLLTKLGFRLLSRRKWRLDMRKIWIAGPDRDWSTIKSELDATVGKQFEVEEGEDE